MRSASKPCTLATLATAALLLTACKSALDVNSPSDLSSGVTFHELTVEPGSHAIDVFEVNRTEYARVTLLGLMTFDPNRPLEVPMGLRTGLFGEDGRCRTNNPGQDVQVSPSFVAHQGPVFGQGTYCLEVYDVGHLTETVTALVRVVHPPPPGYTDKRTQVTSSSISVGGASARTFLVNAPGTVNITLTDLQPSVQTGLGIGLQRTAGVGTQCRLMRSITTTARSSPPHFSVEMDPDEYCVQVFDAGNYTRTTSYVFQVEHP